MFIIFYISFSLIIKIFFIIINKDIKPEDVDEVLLGNVCQANLGQSPARQVLRASGIPDSVDCTTINKVCASGMKSITIGAQTIMLGLNEIVVAGGFESMSNIPYYLDGARTGLKFGHTQLIDGLLKDGLNDAYEPIHMGVCSDRIAKKMNITREELDSYAIESYQKAQTSSEKGYFKDEIVGVEIEGKKGQPPTLITEDEEYKKFFIDKIPTLKPVFTKDGVTTAANASKLNDGASALVLMSSEKAKSLGLKPLARIIGFSDGATQPDEFTVAPTISIQKALKNAGLKVDDVDFFEINEAFASVAIANMRNLGIPKEKLNVWGGAIALGHPIGSSGSRIVVTLANILKRSGKRIGCASICNGGGGSTAIIIENLQ